MKSSTDGVDCCGEVAPVGAIYKINSEAPAFEVQNPTELTRLSEKGYTERLIALTNTTTHALSILI